ncbi:MAG: DinB family protein [Planctomycetales bacterium]
MSQLQDAVNQINLARAYSTGLIDAVDPADWFRTPEGTNIHVAWQVGHLAIAEYHLALARIRGARPEDAAWIPQEFAALFGKGSVPQAAAEKYPSPAEIREAFDQTHAQVQELTSLPDEILDEPLEQPHPMFDSKLGALRFCALHEMTHAGQIGLLRRLFGDDPLR